MFFLQKAATLRDVWGQRVCDFAFWGFLGVDFGLSFSVFSVVFSLPS